MSFIQQSKNYKFIGIEKQLAVTRGWGSGGDYKKVARGRSLWWWNSFASWFCSWLRESTRVIKWDSIKCTRYTNILVLIYIIIISDVTLWGKLEEGYMEYLYTLFATFCKSISFHKKYICTRMYTHTHICIWNILHSFLYQVFTIWCLLYTSSISGAQ